MNLVDALDSFNRKERYWLLRNAIGENITALDKGFSRKLGEKLGIEIPDNAWWAMDYHFDWLIGALHLVSDGKADDPQTNMNTLVKGTQEDIDLIVAFDKTLILIEAKGVTAWSNSQLKSKVTDRLVPIFGETNDRHSHLNLHFVLMSPKKSENLKCEGGVWPAWMLDKQSKQPLFIPLDIPQHKNRVVRWNPETHLPDANGTHWVVTK